MSQDPLHIIETPKLINPTMIIGLSGWMDGGDVSTGTVEYFCGAWQCRKLAEIHPDDFYIYNFPGPMDFTAMFRPHVEIEQGIIQQLDQPKNTFFYNEQNQLIFFLGKEPHLRWNQFIDSVLTLAQNFNCRRIYFIGSFAGLVPHTREPHITCTVSQEVLKRDFHNYNIRMSSYQGPASIMNCLIRAAEQIGLDMISLVAEIPAYVQGRNPRCIEAVVKRMAALLGIHVDLDELREIADEVERKLDKVVKSRPELVEHIKKLEENYDAEMFDSDLGDLKQWLEKQGIRLD